MHSQNMGVLVKDTGEALERTMEERFQDHVVVITGAGGGIGRATALRFAAEGAKVVAVDLDKSGLEETAVAIQQLEGEVLIHVADVTYADQVEGYVAAACEHFGGVDHFFNNAGIEGPRVPLTDYSEEAFEQVLAVNVKGVWLGMKAVVPALRERGGGTIVNTASIAGLGGTPFAIAYGASKHAVVGMTKTAALELAPDQIRVNAVCPGPIETRMMRSIERGTNPDQPEAEYERIKSRIPLERYGEAEEIAAMVAFLSSDDAVYITGGIYPVDGGSRAR